MTKRQLYLALDQGTTSSRAILFDHHLQMLGQASEAYEQHYPRSGWVEHHPADLMETIRRCAGRLLTEHRVQSGELRAAGITNQRETTLVWDRQTGECIYPAIVWQCRRTADLCEQMQQDGWTYYVREQTGLVIDPYFSGTKLKWILQHVPGALQRAKNGELLFGTVDTYLLWQLTGGKVHATDYTNASRTMLFNIRTLDWDDRLLEYLEIPRCMLPEVRPSSGVFGIAEPGMFGGDPVPIAGIAGDQQSALHGQFCDRPGEMKITYGTGAFLLLNTGENFIRSRHGLLTTLGCGTRPGKPEYLLEGSVFMAGAIMQWLRDNLGILPKASMSGEISASIPDTGGVTMIPAFTGLGAPYWRPEIRAALTGMTRGTTFREIIRAGEEAIAFQCWDLVHAMEQDTGEKIAMIRVDGGACQDDFLMQFQTDLLQIPLERPACIESTALGAARLALSSAGIEGETPEISRIYQPSMQEEKRLESLERWQKNIAMILR